MKLITASSRIALLAILATPLTSIASSDFDNAAKEAGIEINNAKAAKHEWRDSQKILDKATAAEKAGDHETAMKLANKAKQQGILAVAQAKAQKDAGSN